MRRKNKALEHDVNQELMAMFEGGDKKDRKSTVRSASMGATKRLGRVLRKKRGTGRVHA